MNVEQENTEAYCSILSDLILETMLWASIYFLHLDRRQLKNNGGKQLSQTHNLNRWWICDWSSVWLQSLYLKCYMTMLPLYFFTYFSNGPSFNVEWRSQWNWAEGAEILFCFNLKLLKLNLINIYCIIS